MMKWLVLAVVVVGLLWWLGRGRSGPRRDAEGEPTAPPQHPRATPQPEPMVPCAHCGVLLPRAEALSGGEPSRPYCSDAHRRAGPREP